MARTDTLNNFLTDVADSIRAKTGSSEPIPASEFDLEISALQSEPNLQNKEVTITENTTTTVTADEGYDGLNTVNVTTTIPSGGINLIGDEVTKVAAEDISQGNFVGAETILYGSTTGTRNDSAVISQYLEIEPDIFLSVFGSSTTAISYNVFGIDGTMQRTIQARKVLHTITNDTLKSQSLKAVLLDNKRVLITQTTTTSSVTNPYSIFLLLCQINDDYTLSVLSNTFVKPTEDKDYMVSQVMRLSSKTQDCILVTTSGAYFFVSVVDDVITPISTQWNLFKDVYASFYSYKGFVQLDNNQFIIFACHQASGESTTYIYADLMLVASDYTVTNETSRSLYIDGWSSWSGASVYSDWISDTLLMVNLTHTTQMQNVTVIFELLATDGLYKFNTKYRPTNAHSAALSKYKYKITVAGDKSTNSLYFAASNNSSNSNGGVHYLTKFKYDIVSNSVTVVGANSVSFAYSPSPYNKYALLVGSGEHHVWFAGAASNPTTITSYMAGRIILGMDDYVKVLTTGTPIGVALETKTTGEEIKVMIP